MELTDKETKLIELIGELITTQRLLINALQVWSQPRYIVNNPPGGNGPPWEITI